MFILDFHSYTKLFVGVPCADYDLVLGLSWLQTYNPVINWRKETIMPCLITQFLVAVPVSGATAMSLIVKTHCKCNCLVLWIHASSRWWGLRAVITEHEQSRLCWPTEWSLCLRDVQAMSSHWKNHLHWHHQCQSHCCHPAWLPSGLCQCLFQRQDLQAASTLSQCEPHHQSWTWHHTLKLTCLSAVRDWDQGSERISDEISEVWVHSEEHITMCVFYLLCF